MNSYSGQHVTVFFCVGLGLLFAAGANLCLRRQSAVCRAAASLLIAAGAVAGAWFLNEDAAAVRLASGILACVLCLSAALGSKWLAQGFAWVAGHVRHPAFRWGTVALVGIAAVVGSLRIDDYLMWKQEIETVELVLLTRIPETRPAFTAASDRGRAIELRSVVNSADEAELRRLEMRILGDPAVRDNIIRRRPAEDRSNCFGWVFTGGRYWVSGNQVEQILAENGYQPVNAPKPGDLIIYRGESRILHAAVVMYVSEGQSVLVEGKWGGIGVYLHAAEKSMYGLDFTYYRSPRNGHLLAGIETPSVPASSPTPTVRLASAAANNPEDDGDDDDFYE